MKRRSTRRLLLRRDTLTPLDADLGSVAGGTLSCVRSCDLACVTVERSYCVGRCIPL